jgi:hypothetical protein
MMLSGTAYWSKILGKPQDGYTAGEREWSIDIGIDEAAEAKYLSEGGSDFYLKEKENHPADGKFIPFKRKEIKQDGTPAKPIKVVGPGGDKDPWDPSVKIGNGSKVNFKFALNEVQVGKVKRLKPSLIAIQVTELVPYEGNAGSGDYEEFPTIDDTDWSEQ